MNEDPPAAGGTASTRVGQTASIAEVTVLNRQRSAPLDRSALEAFVARIASELQVRADSVAICLVSDRRMREANRTFRGKDSTTDVLSFPCDEVAPDGAKHLGDILIAVPCAQRQAAEAGHSLEHELGVLLIHGLLHLLGYDHETDDGDMLQLQGRLVKSHLPDGRGAFSR